MTDRVEKRTNYSKSESLPKRNNDNNLLDSRSNLSNNKSNTTPQEELNYALNFENLKNLGSKTILESQSKLKSMMQKFNNSSFVYPSIVILIYTATVFLLMFQKSVSILFKALVFLIYICLMIFTAITFKNTM